MRFLAVVILVSLSLVRGQLVISSEEDDIFDDADTVGNTGHIDSLAGTVSSIYKKLQNQDSVLSELTQTLAALFGDNDEQEGNQQTGTSFSAIVDQQKLLLEKLNGLETKVDHIRLDQNYDDEEVEDIPENFEGACPRGWIHSSQIGSCYLIHSSSLPWKKAKLRCSRHGAHLVQIDSKEEMQVLETLGKKACYMGTYWTGGKEMNCKWFWDMGPAKPETNIGYTKWLPGEPNNVGMGEDHLSLKLTKNGKVGWNDLNEQVPQRFICEKKAKSESDM